MSAAGATQIERGRAKVAEQHIAIRARGTVKATGQRFYIVAGSTGTQYLVWVGAQSLSCTCSAGTHGKVCKHRVAVHDVLVAEAARAAAERRQQAEARARAEAKERAAAPLRRSNRGVGIWRCDDVA